VYNYPDMEELGHKRGGFLRGFLNSFVSLFIGFVVGVAVMVIKPDLIQRALPFNIKRNIRTVEGKVIAKGQKGKKLLITVDTPEGVVLVTFTRKIAEINLLVEKGDIIALGLSEYEPFVTDPILKRVRKPKIKEKMQTQSTSVDLPSTGH